MHRKFLSLLFVSAISTLIYIATLHWCQRRRELQWSSDILKPKYRNEDFDASPYKTYEAYAMQENQYSPESLDEKIDKNTKPILIHDWTGFFGEPIESHYNLSDCPELNCKLTNNHSEINRSQAIIFHGRDLNWTNIPMVRNSWQYYIFFSLESPAYARLPLDKDSKFFFNLTMSYRQDSDIQISYGYFRKRKRRRVTLNISNIVSRKSKSVAWFAGNCQTVSNREHFVKALKSAGVSIDIYGACTDDHRLSCPRSLQSICDQLLIDHYKFYLSFENSLCKDYVTEKFYDRIKNFVVPIVLERRNYDNVDVVPPKSFIAVDDYPSMQHLARHLAYLEAHHDEYAKYLEWHHSYEIAQCQKRRGGCGFCDLCRHLRQRSAKNMTKPKIVDIQHWWHGLGGCRQVPAETLRQQRVDEETGLLEIAFVFAAVGIGFIGMLFVAVLAASRCIA